MDRELHFINECFTENYRYYKRRLERIFQTLEEAMEFHCCLLEKFYSEIIEHLELRANKEDVYIREQYKTILNAATSDCIKHILDEKASCDDVLHRMEGKYSDIAMLTNDSWKKSVERMEKKFFFDHRKYLKNQFMNVSNDMEEVVFEHLKYLKKESFKLDNTCENFAKHTPSREEWGYWIRKRIEESLEVTQQSFVTSVVTMEAVLQEKKEETYLILLNMTVELAKAYDAWGESRRRKLIKEVKAAEKMINSECSLQHLGLAEAVRTIERETRASFDGSWEDVRGNLGEMAEKLDAAMETDKVEVEYCWRLQLAKAEDRYDTIREELRPPQSIKASSVCDLTTRREFSEEDTPFIALHTRRSETDFVL